MIAFDDLGNLGRLGNQMFQYAALRGLAAKHNYEYCLPPRTVVGTKDSNVFNSDITIFECFKLPDVPRILTSHPRLMESTHCLDINLWDNCPDNVSLVGYFQTEKYFKHIETEIRTAFTFVDEIEQPSRQAFSESFGDSEVIALHIRRGDYLSYPHHPVQPIEYFDRALQLMPSELPVMVFSDGISWCKEQEFFKNNRFIFSENNNTGVDLCLQSLCSRHIISNSSFSWWGSWLANSKLTVAPKLWFSGTKLNYNTNDMYCSQWIIL